MAFGEVHAPKPGEIAELNHSFVGDVVSVPLKKYFQPRQPADNPIILVGELSLFGVESPQVGQVRQMLADDGVRPRIIETLFAVIVVDHRDSLHAVKEIDTQPREEPLGNPRLCVRSRLPFLSIPLFIVVINPAAVVSNPLDRRHLPLDSVDPPSQPHAEQGDANEQGAEAEPEGESTRWFAPVW